MAEFVPVSVTPNIRLHLVPRVASTSLRAAVLGCELRRAWPDEPGAEPRVTVVRHPHRRLLSTWRLICFDWPLHHRTKPYSDRLRGLGYRLGMSLGAFIDVLLERHEADLHTRLQSRYAGPHPQSLVLRLEELSARWSQACALEPSLGALRHVNRSSAGAETLSTSIARRVEHLLAPDFELYESIYTRSTTR